MEVVSDLHYVLDTAMAIAAGLLLHDLTLWLLARVRKR